MELQRFISENPTYLELCKNAGLKVRKKRHLALVTYPYGMTLDASPETIWMRYCRGAVINTDTNKVVCCPPIKAIALTYGDDVINDAQEVCEYQPLIEGTMINLFYDTVDQEWVYCTRGSIGANNKWIDNKSFKTMFTECCPQIDMTLLDTACSYSFVMRHTQNRIISPITENSVYLVEMYRMCEEGLQRQPQSEYPTQFHTSDTSVNVDEFMNIYDRELPYYIKGFTIKCGASRYTYLNPNYLYVKNLMPQSNNPYLNYVELRGNGMLREYLTYFPEYVNDYAMYRDQIHTFTNGLYTMYKNVHIYKTTEKTEIPYHMKPLLYEIHGLFLKEREPIRWSTMKEYIHDLPPKKLLFALNYEFPTKKSTKKSTRDI